MKNYEDVKAKAIAAKSKEELCQLTEEVDALFMRDVEGIIMTDENWQDFTILLADLSAEMIE